MKDFKASLTLGDLLFGIVGSGIAVGLIYFFIS